MKTIDELLEEKKVDEESFEQTVLSDEEMERILNRTIGKIEEMKKEEIPVKKTTKRRFKTMAALVAAATLIMGSCVAASALHLNTVLYNYFGADDKNKDNTSFVQMNQSQTKKGVTVSLEQIIGDEYGFYICLHVSGADNDYCNTTFETSDVKIKGVDTLQWSDVEYSGWDEKGSSYIINVRTADMLKGKPITLTLSNFGYYEDENEEKFVSLCDDTWKFNWKLKYKNASKTIKSGKEVKVYGGSATLHSIQVSPLSVTVNLTEKEKFEEHCDEPNDTIRVQLLDGTAIDSRYVDDVDIFNDTTTISMAFHKIVDYKDIESITFAGLTIPIHKNKHPMERITYKNEAMGLSVSMPEELYNITTVSQELKKDENFNTDAYVLDFTGVKNGITMHMFSIHKIKGMISEKEMEIKNPFMQYLAYKDGYTYSIVFGEFTDEKQMKEFTDIMNKDVATIIPYIDINKSR